MKSPTLNREQKQKGDLINFEGTNLTQVVRETLKPTPKPIELCGYCGTTGECSHRECFKQGQLSQKEKDIRIVRLIPAIRFVNGKRLVDKDKIIEQIHNSKIVLYSRI